MIRSPKNRDTLSEKFGHPSPKNSETLPEKVGEASHRKSERVRFPFHVLAYRQLVEDFGISGSPEKCGVWNLGWVNECIFEKAFERSCPGAGTRALRALENPAKRTGNVTLRT